LEQNKLRQLEIKISKILTGLGPTCQSPSPFTASGSVCQPDPVHQPYAMSPGPLIRHRRPHCSTLWTACFATYHSCSVHVQSCRTVPLMPYASTCKGDANPHKPGISFTTVHRGNHFFPAGHCCCSKLATGSPLHHTPYPAE
jgi:hypothetical protein